MANIRRILAGVWIASNILLLGIHSSNSHNGMKSSRSGRIMKLLSDPKAVRTSSHTHSRADQFPNVLPAPFPPHRVPVVFTKLTHTSVWPQLMRRIQNNVLLPGGPPPHRPPLLNLHRYSQETAKSSHYSPNKVLSLFGAPLSGKSGPYRQQIIGAHPNALPTEAANQGQYQHLQQPNQQQFKASPHYNGEAILHPFTDSMPQFLHVLEQPQHSPSFQYQPILQYPIPQQKLQQYAYHQQQQQEQNDSTPGPDSDSAASYQSPHSIHSFQQMQFKQQSQKSQHFAEHAKRNHSSHLPQPAPHSYSVYENYQEVVERDQTLPSYNKNNHGATEASSAQEAQKYLKFMGSNEYFLPKRDPNYKKLDGDQDQRHYQQQQLVQHQQQQIQYSKSLTGTAVFASTSERTYSHGPSGSTPSGPSYKQPMKVSQLLHHEDPAPAATVMRGNYQADNNVFVFNSNGIKAVKHVVTQAHSAPAKVSPLPTLTQLRNRDRTPEPVRFEFTESDAVPASYTNSPIGHLKYKVIGVPSAITPTSTTATTTSQTAGTNYNSAKQVAEPDNDPEDDEDMQEASSDVYGRVPVRVPVGPFTVPPTEQKDTEDYCEHICVNVQDDDKEIVCGSDGYMYTSEAQMECYASCLHIDVTIQSKGSCSAR